MTDSDEKRIRTTQENPAGRVETDSRGNAVWRWVEDALDSTTILLKQLDNVALSIESTRKVPVPKTPSGMARGAERAANEGPQPSGKHRSGLCLQDDPELEAPGGGFDPYNHGR